MNTIIGVTMGDPAGIGPEIVCKSLLEKDLYDKCRAFVIGNAEVINYAIEKLDLDARINIISEPNEALFEYKTIDILNLPLDYEFKPGVLQVGNGKVALDYIHKAVELLKSNEIDATCTAPTNKEAMKMAGSQHTGATELFGYLLNAKSTSTVIQQGGCFIFQLTTHIPLRKALDLITEDFLYEKVREADSALKEFGLIDANIALSGLNPHAGDGGLLGDEEENIFKPAINRLREEGIIVSDPLPADTIFARGFKGEYDAVILPFHDTANIAIKLVSDKLPAVVITSGLPYIRTTVAHGTAYDIAYKGIADFNQIKQSILAAAEIYARTKIDKNSRRI